MGSRKISQRTSPLQSYFTQSETRALREFLYLLTSEETSLILELFERRCLISKEVKDHCSLRIDNKEEWISLLTNHMSERCLTGLQYVIFVMFHAEFKKLACQLHGIHAIMDHGRLPTSVYKVNVSNRGKIQKYFQNMKKNTQAMNFHNPVAYFTKLFIEFRQKIVTTTLLSGDSNVTKFCDIYIVQLALVIDSMANKTNNIDPNHQLFQDMECIISKTSCPDLSRCMLYGRRAVILSFANKKDDGEELVKQALVCADRVSGCLETVDLLYKIVLFLRAWYEYYPQIITNAIYDHYTRALQILESEPEDVRLLWTRRFVFRLLCCFLGLGMRCRFIKQFKCPSYVQQEAERLLDKYDSPEAELRIRMFYFIAKSRLCELKGSTTDALENINLAKKIATAGNFNELKTILEAEEILFLADAPPLFVETVSSACINRKNPGVSEHIMLPPTYHCPTSSHLKTQYVELINPSAHAPEIVSSEGRGTEVLYRRDEDGYQQRNETTAPRSHGVIHIKSAKLT